MPLLLLGLFFPPPPPQLVLWLVDWACLDLTYGLAACFFALFCFYEGLQPIFGSSVSLLLISLHGSWVYVMTEPTANSSIEAPNDSGTVYSLHSILIEKVVRADFLLATELIYGLIRLCLRSNLERKVSLHLSSFWVPYDLTSLSIWNCLSLLCANIPMGSGENLTIWHHMRLITSIELWGLTTHILVYLWELLLAGGMTEKEITSLCCLSTLA